MFYTMHVRVGRDVRIGYFLFGRLVYTGKRTMFRI